jgi:LuxR family maltose regulon positive regulatory protein
MGLNEGLHRKLTLISAPAGFGKTTLVSEWAAGCERSVGWLSLDEGDNDPTRFLAYLVAALQTVAAHIGEGVLRALQAPQRPATESILTALLNEIVTLPDNFILVLDDYHVIDDKEVGGALAFLLEHLPPQMHLVITTREDPNLSLPRLRAREQLTELRAADLRFTPEEAAGFLNQAMDLNLSAKDVAALESRTEGWIAGLQLAALALQGLVREGLAKQGALPLQRDKDVSSFIKSFTGSHYFVLDYLVEEVLQQQPESVQNFLLQTAILDRLCGPLCAAVLDAPSVSGQETLKYLEQANLFIVPLDNERHWYRYHHLFADLLRQRLRQSATLSMEASASSAVGDVAELHRRASRWYEENGLAVEAFHHAAAANDIERAARLVEGEGMPLIFRGAAAPVLNWLRSLPTTELDARPSLWVIYASALLFVSQISGIEEKLQAAEAALAGIELDDKTKDLIGHIASIRATKAVIQNELDTIVVQSQRALAYLHPDNLPVRTATTWTLGVAYQLQGDRIAARQSFTEALSISQRIGHFIITIMATIGLGNIQEAENELHLAAETYQHALQLAGEPPLPVASEPLLGLARLHYQWDDLETAERYAQQSLQLARQIETNGRFISCEVLLARLRLAQRDVAGARTLLARAEQSVRQYKAVFQMPEVTAVQILALLQQGNVTAAAHLAEMQEHPMSQARVYLAQGDAAKALAVLGQLRQQAEAKHWQDERLKIIVLQAAAYHAAGDEETAVRLLGEGLTLAEPGGFIRLFVDEGRPMAELLMRIKDQVQPQVGRRMRAYVGKLLAAFGEQINVHSSTPNSDPLVEPLSKRELEVLQLIAQGLSNREIGEKLFLALSTVKGHNRNIYGKLAVQRRTEAVARARELGLVQSK